MITKEYFLAEFKQLFDSTDPEKINLKSKFQDIEEWSSLTILSLIVLCEEEFKITISPMEIDKLKRVEDLYIVVSNKSDNGC